MRRKTKQPKHIEFVPSCSLEPTGPFMMDHGDPVTIKLCRLIAEQKDERHNAWKGVRV